MIDKHCDRKQKNSPGFPGPRALGVFAEINEPNAQ